MPKKIIQRYLPDARSIKDNRTLRIFGTLLHNPNLWHMNRRSVAGACGVGMFVAAIPLPLQMVIAAAAAIALRVNLPISIAVVWVTNPITMPALFFIAYLVGATVLGQPIELGMSDFKLSGEWLMEMLHQIGRPFLLGCFLLGAAGAATAYFGVRLLWRLNVVRQWQQRKDIRAARLQ